MVKRAGLTVAEAALDDGPPVAFTNKRTGEVFEVPPGVAPSFAYNVGETANFPDPAKYTGEAFGREAARLAVATRGFERLVARQAKGAAPVGWVDAAIARALDVIVRRVDLSAETMAKQAERHPEVTLREYRQLPALIGEGLVVSDDAGSAVAIFGLLRDDEGRPRLYRTVVKRTSIGEALFLVTFHRAQARQLRLALRRAPIRDQAALRTVRLAADGVMVDGGAA